MKFYLTRKEGKFMIKLDPLTIILTLDSKTRIYSMPLEVGWVEWEVWAEWVAAWAGLKVFSKICSVFRASLRNQMDLRKY
jgi:hypothetical protein